MNFPINIEFWRLISGYDNYEISSHGRVRNNKTNRIMKPSTDKDGYKIISLTNDEKRKAHKVHRLVAFAFLDKNDEHTEVDHIDQNKINNMVNNLRWTTKSVNQRNKSRQHNNTSGESGVCFHKRCNYWVARWCDDEKRKFKSFSVNKYGDAEAKQHAINYRREMAIANGYINV